MFFPVYAGLAFVLARPSYVSKGVGYVVIALCTIIGATILGDSTRFSEEFSPKSLFVDGTEVLSTSSSESDELYMTTILINAALWSVAAGVGLALGKIATFRDDLSWSIIVHGFVVFNVLVMNMFGTQPDAWMEAFWLSILIILVRLSVQAAGIFKETQSNVLSMIVPFGVLLFAATDRYIARYVGMVVVHARETDAETAGVLILSNAVYWLPIAAARSLGHHIETFALSLSYVISVFYHACASTDTCLMADAFGVFAGVVYPGSSTVEDFAMPWLVADGIFARQAVIALVIFVLVHPSKKFVKTLVWIGFLLIQFIVAIAAGIVLTSWGLIGFFLGAVAVGVIVGVFDGKHSVMFVQGLVVSGFLLAGAMFAFVANDPSSSLDYMVSHSLWHTLTALAALIILIATIHDPEDKTGPAIWGCHWL
jgi:hypothetical protein